MKIGLFYFSGTGLTSELAKRIAAEFDRQGHRTERIRFRQGMQQPDLGAYDLAAFGGPTYSFYAPRIFLRFLRSLQGPPGMPYLLFLTSHGMPGITAQSMDRILKRKGFRRAAPPLEGKGVNNIRAWRRKRGKAGHHDVFRVEGDIADWVKGAVDYVSADTPPDTFEPRPLPRRPGLTVFSWLFSRRWQMAAVEGLRKKIDRERCTKCGLCWEKICPAAAIVPSKEGFPKILNRKCAGCSGCVNLCPADAVYTALNYDRWPFTGMKDNIY